MYLHQACIRAIDLPSDGDEKDKTYKPPKKPRKASPSPVRILDSDGEEIIEDVGQKGTLQHVDVSFQTVNMCTITHHMIFI